LNTPFSRRFGIWADILDNNIKKRKEKCSNFFLKRF
jgi:hypothetical protein